MPVSKSNNVIISSIESDFMNAQSALESIRDSYQDRFDNLSDNAQESDKGQLLTETIEQLEAAISAVEEALSALSDCK